MVGWLAVCKKGVGGGFEKRLSVSAVRVTACDKDRDKQTCFFFFPSVCAGLFREESTVYDLRP